MIRIVAIGRMRAGPEAELFTRYATRMRPRLELTEIGESAGAPEEVKRRDGAALLAALPRNAYAVTLDQDGVAADSVGLAGLLERWLGLGRPVCFLIGGAEGLDSAVIGRADASLSLGRLTWPHMLARVMLAEQLYRARAIADGHPYHRTGRPGKGEIRSTKG